VSSLHALLLVLLGLDGIQLAIALVAVEHGRRRHARGEHHLGRYSHSHAALLAGGALLLAVPLVLGLTGAISNRVAIGSVIGAEVVGAAAARILLERMHRAAHGA
jgi:hypothetical protein